MAQFLAWQKQQPLASPQQQLSVVIPPAAPSSPDTGVAAMLQMQMQMQMMQMMMQQNNQAHGSAAAPVITINASSNNNLSNTTTVGNGSGSVETAVTKPTAPVRDATLIGIQLLRRLEEVVASIDRWRPDALHIAQFMRSSEVYREPNWGNSSLTHPDHGHALSTRPPVAFSCDVCGTRVIGKHYGCQPCNWNICWPCTIQREVMRRCIDIQKEVSIQIEIDGSNALWYALRALCYTMVSWLGGAPTVHNGRVRDLTQKAWANMKRGIELSIGSPTLLNLYATTALNLGYSRGVDYLNHALKWSTTAVEQEKDPDKQIQYVRTKQMVQAVIAIRDTPPPPPPPQQSCCCCCTIQ
jgi:hypothetical protein